MKLLKMLSLLTILTVFSFSCSSETYDEKVETLELELTTPQTKTIEIEILEEINNHRLSLGLEPLGDMKIVKSVAFSHTDYMLEIGEVSHDNFFTRSSFLKENAGAKRVSENVAYGYSSARTVVNAWLKSDAHRANIEGDFSYCDVSAEKNEKGRWYFTNIFIKK
ncbi:CAP domain-containing protein [Seonamhaeicola sp. ML3]|uniref:CAP domain-containing protein n=1 Tax=Seonamhaeicola sp. ML3 TaxID=2937786 RepID=UPI00200C5836|nr:CAP domain-containing protein [Seonamhaeicola sp. ML3]